MPADSRIVFDVAADIAAMHRWLPEQIQVRQIAPGLAEAEDETFDVSEDHDALMRSAPEQLRLEWGSKGRPDYTGWLQVTDQAAGASEVVVHLSFHGEAEAHPREAVEQSLQQSLERLAEEVHRRVDAPGY
jgi:polyketide cyclase/dehydrase/lipid transport protein